MIPFRESVCLVLRTLARTVLITEMPRQPPWLGCGQLRIPFPPLKWWLKAWSLRGRRRQNLADSPQAAWESLFKFRPYPPRMKISYFYVSEYLLLN